MNTWQIPLSAKPTVRQIGSYRLGQRPVERWRLLNFWAIHLYRQEAVFIVDGQAFPIRARSVSITPPVVELEYRIPGPLDYLYAHFVFPQGPHHEVPIPVVAELGKDFEKMYEALEVAMSAFPAQPARADARLWDVLWQLAERAAEPHKGGSAGHGQHPAVRQVLRLIERRLGGAIRVAELAEEVGLSQNHLTRLFRASTGNTVLGYVRRRRVDRARHLLTQTTLPIKAIAAELNLSDLHQFNKVIRRELGISPREYRRRERSSV
jgi:AraC family transcriptional regulator